MRILSVVFGIAVLPVGYYLMRQATFSKADAWIVVTLLSTSSVLIYYSQEARAYALFIFLAVTSIFYLYRSIEHQTFGNIVLLVFSLLFLSYTHRYAWFLITAELLCMALYKRWRILAVSGFAMLAVALAVFLQVFNGDFNMGPSGRATDFHSIIDLINMLNTGILGMSNLNNLPNARLLKMPLPILNWILPVISFTIFLIITVLGIKNYRRLSREGSRLFVIICICIIVPTFIALLSGTPLSPHPQWLLRGIIFIVPFYMISAAIAVSHTRYRYILIAPIILINLITLIPYYTNYQRFSDAAMFTRLNSQTVRNDLILSDPWYMFDLLRYYYKGPAPMIGYDKEKGWIDVEEMAVSTQPGQIPLKSLPDVSGNIYVFYRINDLQWLDTFPAVTIYVWDSSQQTWVEYTLPDENLG